MSHSKHARVEAMLARMSRGAVPMGGVYWVDPKEFREYAAERRVDPGAAPRNLEVSAGKTLNVEPARANSKAAGGWLARWWPLRRSGECHE